MIWLIYSDQDHKFLLVFVYSFAFANPEPIENIKVFKAKGYKWDSIYLISGSKKAQQVVFS